MWAPVGYVTVCQPSLLRCAGRALVAVCVGLPAQHAAGWCSAHIAVHLELHHAIRIMHRCPQQ
jgi:hypothetical protein